MAVPKHLSVLKNACLISSEQGRFIHYSLVPDDLLNTLNGNLQEVCPVWRPLKRKARGDRQRAIFTLNYHRIRQSSRERTITWGAILVH